MLESISDMVWVINPANDNFEKLMFRMKEFSAELLEPARINYRFLQEGALQNVQLNVEQRKEIYMIFKEALTNVVKYSEAPEVDVTLSENDGILRVVINDNGVGFPASESSSGNGISNMNARAKQIGAGITVHSAPGKGCSIRLELDIS
jgi:signal transduction histidine kinase